MLRELALLALVVAPACLTEAFTVATPPHAARGTYAARSRHPPLASIGKWRGHAYDTCTTDDESSTSTRSDLLGAGANSLAAAAVAAAAAIVAVGSPLEAAAAAAAEREPEITSKGFIEVRIMEPLNEANGYSSKNAFKGRLVFGIYGKDCPKAGDNFLRYARADRSGDEPSYSEGAITKMDRGVLVEGGKIAGLHAISIGGQEQLEYNGEVITVPPLLENSSVELKHDRRGLLTRPKLARGPEFGVTLAPAPDLDGSHEIFGRLIQGEDVLARLEKVPVYGEANVLEEGSVAANAFKAQNRALVYIGQKVFKDERAVDRTGSLMRRVDIIDCGVL